MGSIFVTGTLIVKQNQVQKGAKILNKWNAKGIYLVIKTSIVLIIVDSLF